MGRFYGITLRDLIDDGLLPVGAVLVSTNATWPAEGVVTPVGGVTVQGNEYPSPSAAATAVKDGGAANGWDFWAVKGDTGSTTLATLRSRFLDVRPVRRGSATKRVPLSR